MPKLKVPFLKPKNPEIRPRRTSQGGVDSGGEVFRRSSTLTGTVSENIPAGAHDRAQLQTPRIEAQQKSRKRRKTAKSAFWIIVLIVAAIAVFLDRVTGYQVVIQNASQLKTIPNIATYEQSAASANNLDLAEHFSATLNPSLIASTLESQHHEIANVVVKKSLFDPHPQVFVTLRQPVLIWKTSHDPQAYYVDSSGVTFTYNAYGNDSKLVQVNDESNVPTTVGSTVTSSQQIAFLGELVGSLQSLSSGSVQLSRVVFPQTSTREIDVYLVGRSFYAKVDLDSSPVQQAGEIVQAVDYLQTHNSLPSQYIDVRVDGRVFYQ
ncbi:MAG TPA: hypothetical protein VGS28_04570 [Candidatus Saccharimonadales bacterium]|nr:hypothetical protein [Candidatus Saccharimonadales bacterium]